jgi:hypothetical protein
MGTDTEHVHHNSTVSVEFEVFGNVQGKEDYNPMQVCCAVLATQTLGSPSINFIDCFSRPHIINTSDNNGKCQ